MNSSVKLASRLADRISRENLISRINSLRILRGEKWEGLDATFNGLDTSTGRVDQTKTNSDGPHAKSEELEKSHRHAAAILKHSSNHYANGGRIPTYREMTPADWIAEHGDFHAYGILGSILPYNVESQGHTTLLFKDKVEAKRGNLILPSEDLLYPSVRFCGKQDPSNPYNSMLLLDADDEFGPSSTYQSFCLWAKVNINDNFQDGFHPSQDDVLPYVLPRLVRGSNTHRIVAVMFKHAMPIDNLAADQITSRKLCVKDLMNSGAEILGYQFFRICWTRQADKLQRIPFNSH